MSNKRFGLPDQEVDQRLGEMREGERKPIWQSREHRFPPREGAITVDMAHKNAQIYLEQRLYHQCLVWARWLFEWYADRGHMPVPRTKFEISEWPQKSSELFRLLFYCNKIMERGEKKWP